MFDDVTKPNEEDKKEAKPSVKAPVEDIFEPAEPAPAPTPVAGEPPSPFAPKDISATPETAIPKPTMPSEPVMSSESPVTAGGSKRKILWWLLIIVIVGIVGLGGYLAYRKFFNQIPTNIDFLDKTTEESDFDIQNGGADVPTDIEVLPLDTDNDGLSNQEESEWNTDILKPDTDEDGLFDREEVKVYNTDPNNPDTDGDGFLDGEEIKAGYNPNGPGLLSEVPIE